MRFKNDKGIEVHNVIAGSVLGPLLWSLMYNGVLRLDMHSRAKVIGQSGGNSGKTNIKSVVSK